MFLLVKVIGYLLLLCGYFIIFPVKEATASPTIS